MPPPQVVGGWNERRQGSELGGDSPPAPHSSGRWTSLCLSWWKNRSWPLQTLSPVGAEFTRCRGGGPSFGKTLAADSIPVLEETLFASLQLAGTLVGWPQGLPSQLETSSLAVTFTSTKPLLSREWPRGDPLKETACLWYLAEPITIVSFQEQPGEMVGSRRHVGAPVWLPGLKTLRVAQSTTELPRCLRRK